MPTTSTQNISRSVSTILVSPTTPKPVIKSKTSKQTTTSQPTKTSSRSSTSTGTVSRTIPTTQTLNLIDNFQNWLFQVISDRKYPEIVVFVDGERKRITPETISPIIIAKLKDAAEEYFGGVVRSVVFSVPPDYDDTHWKMIKQMLVLADLNVFKLQNDESMETTLIHNFGHNLKIENNVMIFNLKHDFFEVFIHTIDSSSFGAPSDER
jgi:molecular chaperone DnaK (HSP70)